MGTRGIVFSANNKYPIRFKRLKIWPGIMGKSCSTNFLTSAVFPSETSPKHQFLETILFNYKHFINKNLTQSAQHYLYNLLG